MTTAAAPDIAPAAPTKSTAQMFIDLCAPLFPPGLVDMRRRCAEAAKAVGASQAQVAAILAVPIEVAAEKGSAE